MLSYDIYRKVGPIIKFETKFSLNVDCHFSISESRANTYKFDCVEIYQTDLLQAFYVVTYVNTATIR